MERLPFLYGNPYRIKRFLTDRTGERGEFSRRFFKKFLEKWTCIGWCDKI